MNGLIFPYVSISFSADGRNTEGVGNVEPKRSVYVDSCSTDHVHRLPGWLQPQTIILIPSPINLGLAQPATASTESISIETWAAVTVVTDFGMQGSP